MSNTIISCILVLVAIALAIFLWIVDKPGPPGVMGYIQLESLFGLIALVALMIIGLIFSIVAVIKEKTILSWVCAIALITPVFFIAVVGPAVEYFQNKAFYAAQYDSPQSQKRRQKMYAKYNLPDSLDISVKNKFVSAGIVDNHYPILSIFNFGNDLWYFSSQEADMDGHNRRASFAEMMEFDKSVVPLLTTLPAMHYATRKDAKSPWVVNEFRLPPKASDDGNDKHE